jgi:segregation and condensation protein B
MTTVTSTPAAREDLAPVEPAGPSTERPPRPSATPVDPSVPCVSPDQLPAVLEAILMVIEEPLAVTDLAVALRLPEDPIREALQALQAGYEEQARGFELRQVGLGWRFFSHPDHAEAVSAFLLSGQSARLSAAALETIAVIAYRQPVSRSRVAAVRGVNVDGVVRTLLARGLVAEVDQDESTGAVLYGTTPLFLEKLGLRSLAELPQLAPLLPDLDAMESPDGDRT